MGPLAGLRVLDLSRILAGPWAGQVFADFGAEVIKVEKPGEGDDTRRWGPPWLADGAGRPTAESAYYLSANRGKRSVAIDLANAEGQALVRALAARSDVLIENYKLGGLAKYGLDWAALERVNPRLVYCSITGFGQSGPYAQRAGYDAAIQAMGGLMSITGEPDGAPGGGPQKVGVAVADLMAGMYAVSAVLAALRHRDATGAGQWLDVSLFDTQVAWLANQALNYLVGGTAPGRLGTAHPNIVPYQVVPCAGGYFMLAVGNDAQFRRCCEVLGEPALADDARFASNAARVEHRELLLERLLPLLARHGARHWIAALEAVGVPCAPVNRIDEVFADPHVAARGLRIELPHPLGGSAPGVANPVRFSATPLEYRDPPPLLGQHTEAVLSGLLGLAPERIAALREAGAIG
jgi:crotonobetainyl-CoA:carnitine CoA-transferase CaiB-like acyl-CoA transferase